MRRIIHGPDRSSTTRGLRRLRRIAPLSCGVVLLVIAGCGGGPRPDAWSLLERDALQDPARVREHLDQTRELAAAQPGEAYWPFHLAEVHLALRDSVAAERALADALARDPLHGPSLALLSGIQFHQGRHAEGIALLEEASTRWIERYPREPFPSDLVAGLALHRDAQGASFPVEDLGSLLSASGNTERSVTPYLLLRAGEVGSAMEAARRALDADPRNPIHRNNYGIALLQAGDAEGAREAFVAAHDAAPELPGPLYNLAIVEEFYFRDHPAARDWFDKYRERAGEDPDGLGEVLGAVAGHEENRP